ncbi:hypothetical protein QBK99_07115 [Corticibacterium sp. UT-5YL-CI-8]|nr:hypothetical protein [Tianweitania sp. UT-5YL-CI-8]
MTLILLAISFAIALTVIAWHFSIYALPFMVGLAAFRYVHATDAGFLMSGLAALGAAFLSVTLIVACSRRREFDPEDRPSRDLRHARGDRRLCAAAWSGAQRLRLHHRASVPLRRWRAVRRHRLDAQHQRIQRRRAVAVNKA